MELIRSGDPAALAGFYDGRAGKVRAYCAAVCLADLVDEATLVSFIDFVARLGSADDKVDVDDLLLKATRGSAAGRLEVDRPSLAGGRVVRRSSQTAQAATCAAVPELLAAHVNAERPADDGQLRRHIDECATCQATAARLLLAEGMFVRAPREEPASYIRSEWLEIAVPRETGAETSQAVEAVASAVDEVGEASEQVEAAPLAVHEIPKPAPQHSPAPQPQTVRARSRGLVGSAKGLAAWLRAPK